MFATTLMFRAFAISVTLVAAKRMVKDGDVQKLHDESQLAEEIDMGSDMSCTRLMDQLPSLKVVPYSTMGTRQMSDGSFQKDLAVALDKSMVIVDPAGHSYMTGDQELEDAGGASGALYSLIGMAEFPDDVVSHCTHVTKAKLHTYDFAGSAVQTNVIHVLSPDLWQYAVEVPWTSAIVDFKNQPPQALMAVKESYINIFREFLTTDYKSKTLRLLPISGGHFAGPYSNQHAQLTYVAMVRAINSIHPQDREKLKQANIEMCIFVENEFAGYSQEAANACY